jgi:hypothetical protein
MSCHASVPRCQVLLVSAPGQHPIASATVEVGAPLPESRDGVTPPFRNARSRHFRPPLGSSAEVVASVHASVLRILGGGAPHAVEFVDVEEEYVLDEAGHGQWVDVTKTAVHKK